jgi:hypothetical protein
MKRLALLPLFLCFISFGSLADVIGSNQVIYDDRGVETKRLTIALAPVDDDVRFSIVFTDKETGAQRRYELDAPVPEVPEPFQIRESYYCGSPVILLSVEYPWRHRWPELRRMIDTYAFRETDFAFIDVAFGPITDIALAEDSVYDPIDLDMLPPIRVRCLTGQDGKPFEFFQEGTK